MKKTEAVSPIPAIIEVAAVLTMQDALRALTDYWSRHGCTLIQPYNSEVGAGTLNPATVLRVLGPEPWRVAYVEPSVRPDDARYGENPNRLQTHTQFQVILKPDPGDPQELYLGSLAALGIDLHAHDVRFVEDNWASPALGAWGLGWEVWLDGLEITQFTYFQQAGGITLDPVPVEITYGIERIMMALQRVDHFKEIRYATGVSYGEIFGQAEYEMSRYYLDEASTDANGRLFEEYAAEARRMLDARLPVPAHNYVLKCSHTFNVLDSRGVVSTTERAAAFKRMRGLARDVAHLWVERRAELGHPLGVVGPPAPAELPVSTAVPGTPATLVFEIGTEELPAGDVTRTAATVRDAVARKLAATRLGHGGIRTYATPRRVVTIVEQVQPREPDSEQTVRGPRVSVAYADDGEPTKAAVGFARGRQVDVAKLRRIDVDGVAHVGVVRPDPGRDAVAVLSELLGQVVAELRADKNMRWNDPKLSFVRPLRWLLALLGDVPVPLAVSALAGGTTTRVLRNAAEPSVEVPSADGYLELLAGEGIVLDPAERRTRIVRAAQRLARDVGGVVDVEGESALIDEITNLVEEPTPIRGGFAEEYLALPSEILMTVMRKHQRYLPVRAADGTLMPYFITVANGSCDQEVVGTGNEAVLRARYEDALFFWRADLDVSPDRFRAALDKLSFAENLGSMADRADRIAAVAQDLGALPMVFMTEAERRTLTRAAALAKFDLASHMVVELTSLAGTMAREYALRAGEPEPVAQALHEMEQPRSAGGQLPRSTPGALLALADRLDLLVGMFGIGSGPTGRSDPFGLRRAASGLVSILRDHTALRSMDVSACLAVAAEHLRARAVDVPATTLDEIREFVTRRYEQQLLDSGQDHRYVAAVLPLAGSPARADETLAELHKRAKAPDFAELVAALLRVRRIVPAGTAAGYDASRLVEPCELSLHQVLGEVRTALGEQPTRLRDFVDTAAALVGPVNTFFDEVLVMDEDADRRATRLGLLAHIRDLSAGVLDWSALGAMPAAGK
ncbi:glycine--tRNA ligase [Streptosporangium roseum]|nr:glycine--tRNA ligase [Streptosporangium roseum]